MQIVVNCKCTFNLMYFFVFKYQKIAVYVFVTADPVNGEWGDWTSYSTCDVTCGDGMKTRTRTCNNPPPSNGGLFCPEGNSETVPCSEQPCASMLTLNKYIFKTLVFHIRIYFDTFA